MKKVLNYILLTAVLGTFLPYSALAQTTDVGVNITGSVSIDVVTTISANITLDLTTGETTPTYMEIQNNSSVPVSAKITNISTTSEGAPSTFVGQYDKAWNSLSKEETNTYVNFNILGEGQNVETQDILSNTEVDLGTLDFLSSSISTYADSGIDWTTNNSVRYYEINANFGKNWDEGDKNFTYQITTVYSQADEYVDQTLSYTYDNMYVNFTRFLYSSVGDWVDIPNVDESKTYISFAIEGEEIVENGLIDGLVNQLNVVVNGEQAVYAGENLMGFAEAFEGHLHYAINKLDSSDNYLNIIVTLGDNTYTFIKKIVV